MNTHSNQKKVGLVLTGGGARAAYQVGVLKAVSDILPFTKDGNPFPVICGSSAGAINATVVAAYAKHFRLGMRRLENVWLNFRCAQIYHSDYSHLAKNAWRWFRTILGTHPKTTLGLLDNSPLVDLLDHVIPYPLIQKAIDSGALHALCVTASSYTSSQSVNFYQAKESMEPWQRHRRIGHATTINKHHLLASAAIPLLFPAVKVDQEYYGDGSMRFLSPLSPALHLGADKLFVIGLNPMDGSREKVKEYHPKGYPTIAEIAGHLMDSVFVDSLEEDFERLQRINNTVKKIPEDISREHIALKNIPALVICPSKDINTIAHDKLHALPDSLQFFLRRIGIYKGGGETILSYLLFEQVFTQALIELGYQDAQAQSKEILNFWQSE